jgi:ABC-type multidrug transport system ATPase subunit
MADRPALIDVSAAVKRFGGLTAVDDVTLAVHGGEIVGLLGANGAGKTTLIKTILGLEALDGGRVLVFGERPSRSTRSRLGYVPQGLGLYTDLSVRQNVEFVAGAFAVKKLPPLPLAVAARARDQVADVGLGVQRQLAFYCALLHEPRLLILDEPTSGVDPIARARLWDTIHEQADAGVAVLVTTHNMQEAEQCDELVLMSHGRKVGAGREADLIGDTTAVEVATASWSAAFDTLSAADLPVTLAGRTVRVAGVSRPRIEAVLAGAGVDATVRDVPATLEEKMVLVDRPAPD